MLLLFAVRVAYFVWHIPTICTQHGLLEKEEGDIAKGTDSWCLQSPGAHVTRERAEMVNPLRIRQWFGLLTKARVFLNILYCPHMSSLSRFCTSCYLCEGMLPREGTGLHELCSESGRQYKATDTERNAKGLDCIGCTF